jgi:FeS assembly SUF system protein
MQQLILKKMLTKIKKLFAKEEDKNSSNDMKTNTSNENEVLSQKNGNNNSEENIVGEIRKDVPVNTEAGSSLQETEKTSSVQNEKHTNEHSVEEIKEEVIKILKTCYDPEIPVDVWELGLIYDIKTATNGDVLIVMTLTSPSCPVAGILPGEIEQKIKDHPMVNDCKVQLTFDPPWSQKNMSEVAKLELGFL